MGDTKLMDKGVKEKEMVEMKKKYMGKRVNY